MTHDCKSDKINYLPQSFYSFFQPRAEKQTEKSKTVNHNGCDSWVFHGCTKFDLYPVITIYDP